MTADITALRIDVADLLTHPATRRSVHLEVPVEGLTGTAAGVPNDEPVVLNLLLERVSDGIVVRGRVQARWRGQCSLCLTELEQTLVVDVSELFEPDPIEGDTYPLEGHILDLEQLVRDAVLLELPLAPTCEQVGANPCEEPVPQDDSPVLIDQRWAALSELEL